MTDLVLLGMFVLLLLIYRKIPAMVDNYILNREKEALEAERDSWRQRSLAFESLILQSKMLDTDGSDAEKIFIAHTQN